MEYLYVGKIVNTHGIKGEVKLLSKFKFKERVFQKNFPIYISIGKEKQLEIINSYRPHKQFDMITIKDYTNINEVLKYKGRSVYIKKEDLVLKEQEYLDEDLIGMKVVVNDKIIGEIVKIEKDRYQDKIIVNKEGKEYLVPYVCDIIKKINIKEHTITLEYIKGLLD